MNNTRIVEIVENLANLFYTDEQKDKLKPEVCYYNGNDGSDFDRKMNDMTCEIGLGWNDIDYYAIKCNFDSQGLRFYIYDHDDPQKIIKGGHLTFKNCDYRVISRRLEKEFDNKDLYNENALFGRIKIIKEKK